MIMIGFSGFKIREKKQNFHQWNRKSYSLFSVLGKAVRIGVLSVIYVLNLAPLKAQSDTVEILRQQDYQLDEVEVRAERTPLALSEVARLITVITKKEIQAAGARSIGELLDHISSVDVRQRGPIGIQSDISINGGTYEQVMILLNGINITDPQTGHFHMDIPVPLEAIERIEVISGSAARVLGPNSYSGAINIVTRLDDERVLDLNAGLGQYKLRKAGIHGGNKFGELKLASSANYASTSGYAKNTDSKNVSAFIRGEYEGNRQSLSFQVGVNSKAFGANSFYTPLYPDQYEETSSLFSSLSWASSGKLNWKQDIYIRYHEDEFHLFRDTAPGWYSGPNNHLSRIIGSHHNFWIDSRLGRTSFGADLRMEKLWSSVLGVSLETADFKDMKDGPILDIGGHRRHTSLYMEQRWGGKRFQISGGLLSHFVNGTSSGMHIYPGLDISYRILGNLKLYSNFSRSLRLPSFTEMYYKSPTHQGNVALLPETAWDYQTGFRFSQNSFSLSSTLNLRWADNSIDWVRIDASEPWETQNIADLFTWSAGFNLMLKEAAFGGIKGLSMKAGYQYTNQVKDESGLKSKYVLDYMKHKANWRTTYRIPGGLLIGTNVMFNDREGDYTSWDVEGNAYQQDYEPFILVDLNLGWQIWKLNLNITVKDVFDTEYADFGHIWQPGRWVMVGVNYELAMPFSAFLSFFECKLKR